MFCQIHTERLDRGRKRAACGSRLLTPVLKSCMLRPVSSEHDRPIKCNSLIGDVVLEPVSVRCAQQSVTVFPVTWPAWVPFRSHSIFLSGDYPGAALSPSWVSVALIPALLHSSWGGHTTCAWFGWVVDRQVWRSYRLHHGHVPLLVKIKDGPNY